MALPIVSGSDGAWGTTLNNFLGGAAGDGTPTIPNNRIPYLGGGNHTSSANLTFDGTTLTVNTLAVSGGSSLTPMIVSTSGAGANIVFTVSSDTGNPAISNRRSRGSPGAETAILSGDAIAGFAGSGHNGSGYFARAQMFVEATENWATNKGARWIIQGCNTGTDATIEWVRLENGGLLINESSNGNMDIGITINQGTSGNHLFDGKSSSVNTGLTNGTLLTNVEIDDWVVLSRTSGARGGVNLLALGEDDVALTEVLSMEVIGGTAETADTTASTGLMTIIISEHDGANATIAMPANSNAFAIRASTGAATYATRMLLKADDGELHLGNTTLVALDDEDDIGLVRAMQWEVSGGQGMRETPWDGTYGTPIFNYEALHRVGVLGERDPQGNCLFRVQPRFAMNEGAIWQLYCKHMELKQQILERLGRIERDVLESKGGINEAT